MAQYIENGLSACAEAGGVDAVVLGFETVEAPDESKFEITGHITDLHTIVLSRSTDCHCR